MTEAPAAAARPPVRIPEWTPGDRLRKTRRMLGYTQAEFAAVLGESAKTYANWEADRHPPASVVALAKRIEMVSGVPATWLLGLDDPQPPTTSPAGRNGGELRGSSSSGKWSPGLGVVIRPSFNSSRTDTEPVAPAAIRDGEAA